MEKESVGGGAARDLRLLKLEIAGSVPSHSALFSFYVTVQAEDVHAVMLSRREASSQEATVEQQSLGRFFTTPCRACSE
jgi:hypothetical protein